MGSAPQSLPRPSRHGEASQGEVGRGTCQGGRLAAPSSRKWEGATVSLAHKGPPWGDNGGASSGPPKAPGCGKGQVKGVGRPRAEGTGLGPGRPRAHRGRLGGGYSWISLFGKTLGTTWEEDTVNMRESPVLGGSLATCRGGGQGQAGAQATADSGPPREDVDPEV